MNALREIILESPRSDIPGIYEKASVSRTTIRMNTLYGGEHILRVYYTCPDGCIRLEANGPVVHGLTARLMPVEVYDGAYGVAGSHAYETELSDDVIDIAAGDHLLMNGSEWEVLDSRRLAWPELAPVESTAPPYPERRSTSRPDPKELTASLVGLYLG